MNTFRNCLLLTLALLFLIGSTVKYNEDIEKLDWSVLSSVDWVWENNYYQAIFNEEQKALDGKEMMIEGFMYPLEYTRKHQNFLVSASPMANCFFCGPGEAEAMIYVQTSVPVDYVYDAMTLKGTFRLVNDASMGIIYELKDAQLVRR